MQHFLYQLHLLMIHNFIQQIAFSLPFAFYGSIFFKFEFVTTILKDVSQLAPNFPSHEGAWKARSRGDQEG